MAWLTLDRLHNHKLDRAILDGVLLLFNTYLAVDGWRAYFWLRQQQRKPVT